MSETKPCPQPTPELAAALANQFIERRIGQGDRTALYMAFAEIIGVFDDEDPHCWALLSAAQALAETLGYPKPYETQVTLADGTKQPPERHTITYFTDGEPGFTGHGFENHDWAAVSALDVGESYVVQGETATMTVTRKDS